MRGKLKNNEMTDTEIEQILRKSFPDAQLQVRTLSGEADSFEVRMAAREFQGKSLVQQHQMVYTSLGDRMKTEIHALKLQTMALETD
jgi:stress-induced morphogen